MARTDGAHGVIGGIPVKYDQNAPDEIGRPSCRHYARSLFRPGTDISGKPGAQNLREERLVWHLTDWAGGEGQVVFNGSDPSARRFYRSEGLNFRVPGQVSLNQSIVQNGPADSSGGAASTSQGSAWSDVTGTSTVVNTTDRRLNLTTPDIIGSETHTPGAGVVKVDFYLYKESSLTTTVTTIQGSSLVAAGGSSAVDGTDYELRSSGAQARTANLASGTELTAGAPTQVRFYLYRETSGSGKPAAVAGECRVARVNGDGTYTVVAKATTNAINNTSTPSSPSATLTFTPQTGETYRYVIQELLGPGILTIDRIDYTVSEAPTTVTVSVRNTSGSSTVTSKQFQLVNTSSAAVVSLQYNSVAATNYSYRVQYDAGAQRPIVDKTVGTVLGTTAKQLSGIELGLAAEVILVGQSSATDPTVWFYNFSTESWDNDNTALAAANNNASIRGMAHTDLWEYGAMSDGRVMQFSASADDDYTAALTDTIGIAICQDRTFVLTQDDSGTNGVQIRTYAVDADVSGGVTSALQTVTVSSAVAAADVTLKQHMCATPTGARFFVNYSDVSSVIYEADASGSTTVVREVARLDAGTKATAILHVAGHTFVAGQTYAETGESNRSLLYVIDQSNTPRAIGYFRRDNPSTDPVCSMQAFQQDLWMLQGKYIWRFSLASGGLFCEYELNPGKSNEQIGIAVVQGHVFAVFASEDATNTGGTVWVAGTVGTYRQSSISGGSSLTSSIYDFGLPGETKQLLTAKVVTDTLTSGDSVTVEVQTDQSGTWTLVGSHTEGKETTIQVSDSVAQTLFRTLQVRITLNTDDGTSTPVVHAVVIEARVIGFEEFFDVTVLTDDEDAAFHVAGLNRTGGEVKQALWDLMRNNAPVSFIDAYEHKALDNNPEYLVVIEAPDTSDDDVGEGRMTMHMRVIPSG